MDNKPAPETSATQETPPPNDASETPDPEVLKPRTDDSSDASKEAVSALPTTPQPGKKRRRTYRPSHKATFISLAVVVAILVINAGVLVFVLGKKAKLNDQGANDKVTINQSVLDKLGVNRGPIGDAGIGLTIGPNTQFKNDVAVAGSLNISGQLKVNDKFTANDASLTQLKAGDTSLDKLNVNNDITASNVNLRKDLLVQGSTRLQGAVIIRQLLTVYSNLNVAGNLNVGGTFSVRSLTSNGTLTIGGHFITGGGAPSVSAGGHIGSNGTVSISGNDVAGTVAVNTGVGASSGIVANIVFHTNFSSTPHVVITPVGTGCTFFITRNSNGFSIGINGPAIAGYAFDYIIAQ